MTKLTKEDAGGFAGMQDEGDDSKSGYSDAFERAAVKFGIGRHLYGDGIPDYAPARAQDDRRPKIRALDRSIKDILGSAEDQLKQGINGEPRPIPVKDADVLRNLYAWAVDTKRVSDGARKPETLKECRFALNDLFEELNESGKNDMLAEAARFVTTSLIETYGV